MSEQATKVTAATSPSTQATQDTHDEIDQILNEVEVLRKELDAAGPSFFNSPETPEPAAAPVAAAPASAPLPVPSPASPTEAPVASATPAVAATSGPSLEEIMDSNDKSGVLSAAAQAEVREVAEAADELMKEFHSALEQGSESSSDDPAEEDTGPSGMPVNPEMTGMPRGPGMEDTLASVKVDTSVKTLLDDVETEEEAPQSSSADSADEELPEFDRAPYAESNVIALHDKVVATQQRPQSATIPSAAGSSIAPAASAEPGCLKMTLSGNMTLKLQYEFAGQEVMISFIDDCLKVETHGGAEFKIPFGSAATSKKKSSQAV